jgi:4'-phosphopantetheinyl transferase
VKCAPAQGSPQAPPRRAVGTQRVQGCIDLWHANLQYTRWRRLLPLLSDEEHRRAQAYAFDRDARRFVVSRAVLRTLLSHSTGVPAGELKFRLEPDGKPFLQPGIGQRVHFSLSRSQELVLIGFAPGPLGVDVEWLDRAMNVEALVDHVLSCREQDNFKRFDPRDQRTAFLQCWTIKEAYLKAIGKGLLVPPAMVEVSLRSGRRAALQSIFGDAGAASCWFVNLVAPREGYIGAVASRGGSWRTRVRAFDTGSLILCEQSRGKPGHETRSAGF